jgi:transposase-like protein
MKRTRKWAYVEQEAKRLVAIGLGHTEIAKRLGVNDSTIRRWVKAGKLEKVRRGRVHTPRGSPQEWAAAVRKDFSLDGTDEELLGLAQTALEMSLDPLMAPSVRLTAIGRFQAVVKQLALPARLADQGPIVAAKPDPPAPRTPRPDPRGLLMAVK